MSAKYRIESGVQLLTRLTKKSSLENFYPKLFGNGPKFGDFIELYSEYSTTCILVDLICQVLIHSELNGTDGSVIIFDTDGNLDLDYVLKILRNKLENQMLKSTSLNSLTNIDSLIDSVIKKVYIHNIYDPTQYYITIQNIENVLMKYPNVTLLVFDTITAFYWCEQHYKIAKMDTYLKNILDLIKKTIKDFKVTILYTRPKYFGSNKDTVENYGISTKDTSDVQSKYKIEIVYNDNQPHYVIIKTLNKRFELKFTVTNDGIIWF